MDWNQPFIMHCDQFQGCLGAVIYQRQKAKWHCSWVSPSDNNYLVHSGKPMLLALKSCPLLQTSSIQTLTLSHVLTTGSQSLASELVDFNFTLKYQGCSMLSLVCIECSLHFNYIKLYTEEVCSNLICTIVKGERNSQWEGLSIQVAHLWYIEQSMHTG